MLLGSHVQYIKILPVSGLTAQFLFSVSVYEDISWGIVMLKSSDGHVTAVNQSYNGHSVSTVTR